MNNNRLTKRQPQQAENSVVYQANGVDVKLSPSLVKNYLVSGNKESVTAQEVAVFINLCKYSGLNPWLREAYCIKYGTSPATMVVGKDAFLKRAEASPFYDGFEAGIIVFLDETGDIVYRKGTFHVPDEKIIGGYAEVWRKDRTHSTRVEVSFDEYAARRKDGTLNDQWSKKPATMIRKVALVQALREAFPGAVGGMYTAEEQGETEPEYTAPVVVQEAPPDQQQPEPQVENTENSENDAVKTLFDGD